MHTYGVLNLVLCIFNTQYIATEHHSEIIEYTEASITLHCHYPTSYEIHPTKEDRNTSIFRVN